MDLDGDFVTQEKTRSWSLPRQINEESEKKQALWYQNMNAFLQDHL
jgi:hypothetical protein